MLDKKQIWVISFLFFLSPKWVTKEAETTGNISNASGPGTANECTVQWWFKKFCKGDARLEDEECSGWPSEVNHHHLRETIEAGPITTTWEVAEELYINHFMVFQHLKQIGKMKKFDKWFPHKVTRNKNIVLKCCLLLFYATTMKHFLIRLWQATKSGFYTTTGNAQLSVVRPRNSSKTLPKVKLAPKKSHVTVCWSAAHLIHYSFLNLSAAIVTEKYAQQIDEMH